jgi:hypothetical protein
VTMPVEPAWHPPSGWTPIPDPTKLTTDAVNAVTEQYRRDLSTLRELIEGRLSAMDKAVELLASQVGSFPTATDKAISSLGDLLSTRMDGMDASRQQYLMQLDARDVQLDVRVASLRDVIETRLNGMDKATELLAAQVGAFPTETDKAVGALQQLLSVRIDASVAARELLERRFGEDVQGLRTEYQAALEAAEVNRKEALGQAALTIQNGLDKAERQLQIALDKAERQLQVGLEAAEKRVNEKLDLANEKIEAGLIALRQSLTQEVSNVENVSQQRFKGVEGTFASNALALTAALAAQKEAAAEQNKSNTLAISKSETATKETIAANAATTASGQASQAATIADLKDRLVRLEAGGVAATGMRNEQRAERGVQGLDETSTYYRTSQARAQISVFISAFAGLIALVSVIVVVVVK